MTTEFPKTVIIDIKHDENNITISCKIDKTTYKFPRKEQKWIDDEWLGYLKKDDSLFYGKWHKTKADIWNFVLLKKYDVDMLQCGETFECLDGYYGERAEIVLDKNLSWEHETYNEPENHEHCNICWATIEAEKESKYMKSTESDIVCMNCFDKYVSTKSLEFINNV